ncbi:hypothetical protein HNY73_010698 [Argiope bruennichi]|uniref:Uncharacterized protein n=1 Tax=Argiope bruennichi TaxID=94029 RepID=A0A8T0F2Q0_ARGBR|nr:hypothetical protein HNY73_010698 [Argiope bruennichi]
MGYEETHMHSLRINKRNFFISEIYSKERWRMTYEAQSQCSDSVPNSSEVILILTKNVPFHNFKIFAKVRRTDDGADRLNGVLIIRFQNMEEKKSSVKYVLSCDLKGQEMASEVFEIRDEHYKSLLSENDGFTFPGDVLIVRVKLIVLCRHDHKVHRNLAENKLQPAGENKNKVVKGKERRGESKAGSSIQNHKHKR